MEKIKTITNVRIYSNNEIQTLKKNQDELNRELKNKIILSENSEESFTRQKTKSSGLEHNLDKISRE